MIVVLSMNTAFDRVVEIPRFKTGEVHRARRAQVFAGGKALNVVRVIRQLGQPVRVIGTLGGTPDRSIRSWCDDMKIDAHWIAIKGESRTCVIVVDPAAEEQTVLNEPGPTLIGDEVQRIRKEIDRASGAGDTLCISGSAPPGVPTTFYADVVTTAKKRGVRVLLDASGPALRHALDAGPWAAVPNVQECAEVFGAQAEPAVLATWLAERTEHALLTLGADGVLYAGASGRWHLTPPATVTVNAVGSGDALVAGFVTGMAEGLSPLESARRGVACGAANAAGFGPGIDTGSDIGLLVSEVQAQRL